MLSHFFNMQNLVKGFLPGYNIVKSFIQGKLFIQRYENCFFLVVSHVLDFIATIDKRT